LYFEYYGDLINCISLFGVYNMNNYFSKFVDGVCNYGAKSLVSLPWVSKNVLHPLSRSGIGNPNYQLKKQDTNNYISCKQRTTPESRYFRKDI
jgi:hypothetical protein